MFFVFFSFFFRFCIILNYCWNGKWRWRIGEYFSGLCVVYLLFVLVHDWRRNLFFTYNQSATAAEPGPGASKRRSTRVQTREASRKNIIVSCFCVLFCFLLQLCKFYLLYILMYITLLWIYFHGLGAFLDFFRFKYCI